ncbi:hypothetical protein RND61_00420 [Streptomyces sp. TRM76323]|uniref:Uncharacterized protein n=1 Tax=Streptomyces tamarix TaxID=3078565 RepID=A0ABU3QDW1_9ACTN|nr:hypothetical protein [Streptomyces tamarix]MDT9680557.1 hypothetical protein [Streptomyces tamarix]
MIQYDLVEPGLATCAEPRCRTAGARAAAPAAPTAAPPRSGPAPDPVPAPVRGDGSPVRRAAVPPRTPAA